jgi:hypothetical protein
MPAGSPSRAGTFPAPVARFLIGVLFGLYSVVAHAQEMPNGYVGAWGRIWQAPIDPCAGLLANGEVDSHWVGLRISPTEITHNANERYAVVSIKSSANGGLFIVEKNDRENYENILQLNGDTLQDAEGRYQRCHVTGG